MEETCNVTFTFTTNAGSISFTVFDFDQNNAEDWEDYINQTYDQKQFQWGMGNRTNLEVIYLQKEKKYLFKSINQERFTNVHYTVELYISQETVQESVKLMKSFQYFNTNN